MKNVIVGLGEILWDILPEGKVLGGAPANFVYHASQFGNKSLAISALGNDELANKTIAALEEKGLKHIMPRISYPTGTVQVTLNEQGVPSYEIKKNVAWDCIPFSDEIENAARNCRAVCWGSLAQRSEVSRDTIQKFLDATPDQCLRIFDINLRQDFYTKEVIEESLKKCNILKINDEELAIIGQMLGFPKQDIRNECKMIIERYKLDMLVLTCGINGSYVFTPNLVSYKETPKVKVADTVGAGDSFTGAFCAAILDGKTIEEAHSLAVKVSAFVCTCIGAMPKLPEELIIEKGA